MTLTRDDAEYLREHFKEGYCGSCCFWWPDVTPKEGRKRINSGECRRHAPSAAGWGLTRIDDGCGDFKDNQATLDELDRLNEEYEEWKRSEAAEDKEGE